MAPQTLNCEQATRLFFAYLDRALEGDDLASLENHLHECVHCCGQVEFSRKLDTFVRASLGDAPLPTGIAERIRRAIAVDPTSETGR